MKVFFPSGNSYSLLFILSLGSLGFFAGILLPIAFCLHHIPSIWLGNSRFKWWAAFKISQTQTFESIKEWIDSKKPTKTKTPIWTQPLPDPFAWPQTPSKNYFPSNSAYKAYLKRVQEQEAETLTRLSESDEDEEDIASSSAFQQNEDVLWAPIHSP